MLCMVVYGLDCFVLFCFVCNLYGFMVSTL